MAGGKTVFFKMHGNATLAESQKNEFVHWIGSVQTGEPTTTVATAAAAPGAATVPEAPNSADSERPTIKWEVPDGWKSVPGSSSMRYATFAAAGKNGGTAEISVVVLPGEAGGDLQNVNRWRGQIGLGPMAETDLKALIVPVNAKEGDILTVDMAGEKAHLLAGWTRIGGKSWFFKLTGPDPLVGAEKDKFTKFLESVQFHP